MTKPELVNRRCSSPRRSLFVVGLALLAGAFFACAGPPFDLVVALWIGMACLAYLLEIGPEAKTTSIFRGGWMGLAFGVGANVVAFRFVPGVITRFTPLPWAVGVLALLLLSMAQALRWLVAVWVRHALVRWRVPGPVAFAAGVYAGTFVPMIFPWNPAGAATLHPELLQLADIVGERGVSALMALSAGLFASAAAAQTAERRHRLAIAAGALAIPLASYVHGRFRMADVEAQRAGAQTARVALVQPSIGATQRWQRHRAAQILAQLTELTERAEQDGAELTVWHESAYPYELGHRAQRAPKGAWDPLQPGVRGPVLTGVILHGGESDKFNSALIAYPDGAVSAPYDKMHLLWFGEAVPLANEIPWIRRTFARGVGLSRGHEQVLLPSGKVRASVLVCFEDTLPEAGREAMALSPNLLVNLTNDAWFTAEGSADTSLPPGPPGSLSSGSVPRRQGAGGSGDAQDEASLESELHLRMAIMRSIEARRDMVRAVNYGPTTWVDAAGRVRARYASSSPEILVTTPALLETPATLYMRLGDIPFSLALALSTLALGLWGTKRKRR